MSVSAAFSYDQLVAALQDWVDDDNAEYVAALPTLILLAESQVATDLNLELFDRTASGSMTASQEIQDILPATQQSVRSFFIQDAGGGGVRRNLLHRPYDYLRFHSPDPADEGEPRFWSYLSEDDTDNSIRVAVSPTPDAAYTYTIRYVGPPESLTSGNQNTWLATNCGDMLFWKAYYLTQIYLAAEDTGETQRAAQQYADLLATRSIELRAAKRKGDYTPQVTPSQVPS